MLQQGSILKLLSKKTVNSNFCRKKKPRLNGAFNGFYYTF